MLDNYGIRTDLALEATERFTEENVEVRGVEVHEDYNEEKDIRTTVVKITTENGARTMGRPQGSYITIEAPGLSVHDEDYHREISLEIARHLQNVINLERELSILVVGLGNSAITADSLYDLRCLHACLRHYSRDNSADTVHFFFSKTLQAILSYHMSRYMKVLYHMRPQGIGCDR